MGAVFGVSAVCAGLGALFVRFLGVVTAVLAVVGDAAFVGAFGAGFVEVWSSSPPVSPVAPVVDAARTGGAAGGSVGAGAAAIVVVQGYFLVNLLIAWIFG